MADNGFPVAQGGQEQDTSSALTTTDSSQSKDLVAQNTESMPAVGADEDVDTSKTSSIKGFFKDGEMVHRLIILGFLVIFVAAIIFAVISFSSSGKSPESERKLGQYSTQDIGSVLDFLENEGYKYRLSGNTISVDVKDYNEITEKMLRKGIALPQEKTDEGDQIIMSDTGFGVSQRMENERIKHGREVQLARAIERIDGVQHATVLLAIPKENVFAREKSRPSAAVVVTLKQNAYLTPENVNSIRFLVSSSVHNLMSKDVSVTDQQGRQLSAEVKTDTAENKLQREFEIRTMREAQYRDKLDTILAPMLGLGNYSSEVDVTLDTTVQEETSQLYNPDSQAVRSETLKEQSGNDEKTNPYGVPGSLSNQPPANASIPQQLKNGTANAASTTSDNKKESREAVRNYEVDTTLRHTVRPSNVVQRLTVSVAVDYVKQLDKDGNITYVPRSQEDLDKIADLVRGGLGLNESRGDFVKVETVSFPHGDIKPPLPWYEQEFFYRLVRIGGSIIIVLIVIIFIIRPLLNKLLHKDEDELNPDVDQDELDSQSALDGYDDFNLIAKNKELADQVYTINHEGGIELPNLHKEADLLKAVRTLASNEPQLTAEVIKDWLEEDLKEKA
ncbi:MAG: flagellar basal-body MS-ring/collar protein FliF [Succinivibrio sp.]|jgi:flagellar M-ring protein fliF|uniref:flagellar basal-body MS-ring/collar protein FliF n=1 Tax=Succinivibrio sp. TaxID=2053619 RepID=UPI000D7A402B|nr:flagellar M-ring protein FliF [Succinivibrio sp.]MCI7252053.1 flagellar M-ring protein FliF [Succinatimonas sp.]HJI59800.1 flagellar basal-body MS-ring/collar protein FliF [Succinivibrionaceae bacterium]MDD6377392.1 flagellar basal-body MS-ring/collar protein FliF [Succinatimonas sp.]MDY5064153.1 flagellar basal-body MS-ring/collar protein FliF [Succinivibrio sp.]